jgi:hypothetical protein
MSESSARAMRAAQPITATKSEVFRIYLTGVERAKVTKVYCGGSLQLFACNALVADFRILAVHAFAPSVVRKCIWFARAAAPKACLYLNFVVDAVLRFLIA